MLALKKKKIKTQIKLLYNSIRPLITYLFDTFILFLSFPSVSNSGNKKKVLIIRLDVVGDFVLWLDSAKELRKLYPKHTYHITLLANNVWSPLAESLEYFDEIWPLESLKFYKNLQYRWQQFLKIRRAAFDIAIQPTFSREFLFGDSIIRFCNARERIGSESDCTHLRPWLKPTSDAWYTKLIPATAKPLMELERNAEFVRGLGLNDFRAGLPLLSISDDSRVTHANYFVISPGSSMPYKQWDINCFREIARRLHLTTGWNVVVCGGPGEERLGVDLVHDADFPFINRVGTTSLLELVSIIDNASLVIANDSSAIHIASAVSTPSVCILGGGHYGRFVPYKTEVETDRSLHLVVAHQMDCFGCSWQCRYDVPQDHTMPCIEKITVEDVWEAIVNTNADVSLCDLVKQTFGAEKEKDA